MSWNVIVPVKGGYRAKSRLIPPDHELARAFAVDTIFAALNASLVEKVVVPTSDTGALAVATRAVFVRETKPRGIHSAIEAALRESDPASPRAVLLGDLPALRPQDLDEALALAAQHPAAFVADFDGTGTTLVTANAGEPLVTAFGLNSAQAHRDLGLFELPIPPKSRLRRDVDTAEELAAVEKLGLGFFTRMNRDRAR